MRAEDPRSEPDIEWPGLAADSDGRSIVARSCRDIANAIVDAGKKMAPSLGAVQESEDLYWRFLVIAAIFPFIGLPFLRDRPELWIQAIGAAAVLIAISTILG